MFERQDGSGRVGSGRGRKNHRFLIKIRLKSIDFERRDVAREYPGSIGKITDLAGRLRSSFGQNSLGYKRWICAQK